MEIALETSVHEIRDDIEPNYSVFEELRSLPSKFPWAGNCRQYQYIVDLDREILTINNTVHFKLNNIPRQQHMDALYLGQHN